VGDGGSDASAEEIRSENGAESDGSGRKAVGVGISFETEPVLSAGYRGESY
jgi:hypothetical protein